LHYNSSRLMLVFSTARNEFGISLGVESKRRMDKAEGFRFLRTFQKGFVCHHLYTSGSRCSTPQATGQRQHRMYIAGLITAGPATSSAAPQQRCRPLYGEHSADKKYSDYVKGGCQPLSFF